MLPPPLHHWISSFAEVIKILREQGYTVRDSDAPDDK